MSKLRILTATALVTALAVSAGYAQQQQQQTQRLAGTIERVDGNTIFAKGRDGSAITLNVPDNVVVTAVFKATVADIKPGAYIGSGATPQADGSQKAVEVHILQESMRGQGDGHRPGWYGAQNGTMTNGASSQPVRSATVAVAGSRACREVQEATSGLWCPRTRTSHAMKSAAGAISRPARPSASRRR
jgi:hypothetical protein